MQQTLPASNNVPGENNNDHSTFIHYFGNASESHTIPANFRESNLILELSIGAARNPGLDRFSLVRAGVSLGAPGTGNSHVLQGLETLMLLKGLATLMLLH